MKILLINNYSKYITQLQQTLDKNYVITIFAENVKQEMVKNFDAIILSGGSKYEVVDHANDVFVEELKIIKNSTKPIFGICLGFQLICYTFGSKIKKLATPVNKIIKIKKTLEDPVLEGLGEEFSVYEAHEWGVKKVSNLTILAKTDYGVEIVKHPLKPIYGVEFHPEIHVNEIEGFRVLKNFLELYS